MSWARPSLPRYPVILFSNFVCGANPIWLLVHHVSIYWPTNCTMSSKQREARVNDFLMLLCTVFSVTFVFCVWRFSSRQGCQNCDSVIRFYDFTIRTNLYDSTILVLRIYVSTILIVKILQFAILPSKLRSDSKSRFWQPWFQIMMTIIKWLRIWSWEMFAYTRNLGLRRPPKQGCQNHNFESDRSFDGRIANCRIFTIRIIET